jgi:hypothetical protein
MNPHWSDYEVLVRGDGVFADPTMAAIIFKTKFSALMKQIQKNLILEKVSASVWRIKYQKRSVICSVPLLD